MIYVTVNKTAPAHLVKGITVNGGRYYAWDICGREVFISKTKAAATKKMKRAISNGVTF